MRLQNNFGPILSSNSSQSEFEVENEKKETNVCVKLKPSHGFQQKCLHERLVELGWNYLLYVGFTINHEAMEFHDILIEMIVF